MVGFWLSSYAICFEQFAGTRVHFSGDFAAVKPTDRVLLIANHRTRVDWLYLFLYVGRFGSLSHLKIVLKAGLRHIPVVGWGSVASVALICVI